jgi:hypothetical protein
MLVEVPLPPSSRIIGLMPTAHRMMPSTMSTKIDPIPPPPRPPRITPPGMRIRGPAPPKPPDRPRRSSMLELCRLPRQRIRISPRKGSSIHRKCPPSFWFRNDVTGRRSYRIRRPRPASPHHFKGGRTHLSQTSATVRPKLRRWKAWSADDRINGQANQCI